MLQKLVFPDAELYIQGAHLTQFKDWLYLSSRSAFEEGKAIRGGIPIVFPWFGPSRIDARAPQHGWARTFQWEVLGSSDSEVSLRAQHDEWEIQVGYEFGDTLRADVTVRNLSARIRSFELALHTYFAVADVNGVEIEGLSELTYLDKTRDGARLVQDGVVRFEGEVDRVYLGAPSVLGIRDGAGGFELRGNWRSAVTWNPGATKAATMKDLGQGEWSRFVCLEVGAMADDAVELAPRETWNMSLEIEKTV